MYLFIMTSNPQAEIYLYDGDTKVGETIWLADRHLAETIHKEIRSLLALKGLSEQDLTGIGIFRGPGSFTGLRIGHSVANSFAYSLGLPIVGALGDNWLGDAVHRLDSGENDKIVSPFYGAPPRTTKPRK